MTSNNITEILLDTIQLMIEHQNTVTLDEVRKIVKENEIEDYFIEPIAVIEPLEQTIPIEIKSFDNVSTNIKTVWPLAQKAAFYNRFNIEFVYLDGDNEDYGFEFVVKGKNGFTLLSWRSNEDVLGNPRFTNMIHKKSYDISELQNIEDIAIKQYGNASLSNLKLSIGFDASTYAETANEPLVIYGTSANPTYSSVNRSNDISLQWIYNIDSSTFGAITSQRYNTIEEATRALADQKATVYWYVYNKENLVCDSYLGVYWERQESFDNQLSYIYTTTKDDMAKTKVQIRAVIVQNDSGTDKPKIFKSNILEIKNTFEEPALGTLTNANIALVDDLNGNYYLYDYDNYLIQSEWYQSAKIRQARMNFDVSGKSQASFIESFDKIVWRVPNNAKAIADRFDTSAWTKTFYPGYTAYTKIQNFLEQDLVLEYRISNYFEPGDDDIPLSCEIVLKDKRSFRGERNIKFAYKNFETKEYRVISRLFKGDIIVKNQAYSSSSKQEQVRLSVFDPNGQKVEFDSNKINQSIPYTKGTIQINNNFIEYIYAFPISSSEDYFYNGATEVVYDSSGTNPQYLTTPCELIVWRGNVPGGSWELSDENNNLKDTIIDFNSNQRVLLPKNSYLQNMANASVNLTYGGYWTQPIIIHQNLHFSSIIDEWNGGITIDEENRHIMASAYVAGKKEGEGNKLFTGAILGDLQTIANQSVTNESGLFGYNQGVQSFGFKTDGTAFIGKAGGGRINFDGNGGTIQSGNYVYHITVDKNGVGGVYLGTTNSGFTLYVDMSANAFNGTEGTCRIYATKSTLITTTREYTFKINDSNQYELFQSSAQNAVPHWFTYDSTKHTFEFYSSVGLRYSNTQVVESSETVVLDLNRGTNSDKFSISGTLIDLNQGLIRTPGFFLDTTGNVYMKGEIDAISGSFSGFYISSSHLGNAKELANSTFALLGKSELKGVESQKLPGIDDDGGGEAGLPIQTTGESPIIFYSGKNLNNKDTNQLIQDKVSFYVTESGFVKANNFYSEGIIVNQGNGYQAALREGQLRIKSIMPDISSQPIMVYSYKGLVYNEMPQDEGYKSGNNLSLLFNDPSAGGKNTLSLKKASLVLSQGNLVLSKSQPIIFKNAFVATTDSDLKEIGPLFKFTAQLDGSIAMECGVYANVSPGALHLFVKILN